ncbi:MAG: adenine-specific methyltransferase EcoRI family protein [Prevotellaceae bacterium]|nr:adenine-specific methyltransferase EcoRI family protein [Prevotellaceae bacterium]
MQVNRKLSLAKAANNDEFYTQYNDIQTEVNAYLDYNPDVFRDKTVLLPCDDPEWSNFTKFFVTNFNYFGLKKLISTSYAHSAKNVSFAWQPTLFETSNVNYNKDLSQTHGKVFLLDKGKVNTKRINIDNLRWYYLQGTGDFNSLEVKELRDEADIIVTNPPFSLFRNFVAWIFEAEKDFIIIGSQNAVTYKEVFPLIKGNRMWMGKGFSGGNAYFFTPYIEKYGDGVLMEDTGLVKFRNCLWFTNLDHGRRHEPLQLLTMEENRKHSKHKDIRETGYQKFDNYDAINVPYIDAIPSDYDGVMGVPITFLDKYCPEQFEIVEFPGTSIPGVIKNAEGKINGKITYARVLIRKKQ